MAYDDVYLLRDKSGKTPIPQFYNPAVNLYRPLTGADLGGGRYGADNLMWGKTAGGLFVPVQVGANGEVVTQLSGRNVEITRASGITVAASETVIVTDKVEISRFPIQYVTVRTDGAHLFRVQLYYQPTSGLSFGATIIPALTVIDTEAGLYSFFDSGGARAASDWVEARGATVAAVINNKDTMSHVYDIVVYGVG